MKGCNRLVPTFTRWGGGGEMGVEYEKGIAGLVVVGTLYVPPAPFSLRCCLRSCRTFSGAAGGVCGEECEENRGVETS